MANSEVQLADAATPGQRLREARERAGISPREMADRLNWLPSYVTAIEEDRYESLRSTAFVRGYLRAYARTLGLNADELVDSFDSLTSDTDQQQHEIVSPISPASNQKTGLSVVIGIVIAVGVVGLIWWQSTSEPARESPVEPASGPTAESSPVESAQGATASAVDARSAPAAAAAAPGAAREESDIRGGLARSTTEGVDSAPREVEGSVAIKTAELGGMEDASPEAVVLENSPAADDDSEAAPLTEQRQASSSARDAEASGEATAEVAAPSADQASAALQFAFSGDCWLEVRDADGALIFADLRGTGDTLFLDGTPPFDVLAGNAGAVTLRYRGEPFPVRARPGRAIARFTVGEP